MSEQRTLEVRLLSSAKDNNETMKVMAHALGQYRYSDSALGWVWSKFQTCHKNAELPSIATMRAYIRTEPAEAKKFLGEAVTEVWRADPSTSPATDCDALRRLHAEDHITDGVQKVTKALMRKDVDGARDMMERVARSSPGLNGTHLKSVPLIDFDDWLSDPKASKGILTGVRRLDEELLGGMSPGEMMMVYATTGMGKSMLVTGGLAFAAIKQGYPVLHIDSENGEAKVRSRYVARMTGTPGRLLERKRVQKSDHLMAWAKRRKDDLDKQLRILCMGVGQTKFSELREAIDNIIQGGFKPAVVIIDSPDHLMLPGSDNNALDVKQTWEQLKGLALELNVVLYVTTQAKAEAEDRIPTIKDVAWGQDKARITDVSVSIAGPMDKKGNIIPAKKCAGNPFRTLFIGKARSGASRFAVRMETNFAYSYMKQSEEQQETAPEVEDGAGDDV